jgi:hypothetical protein
MALGKQFEEIAAKLQELYDPASPNDHLKLIEATLAYLEPIERAIMATPARTIAGLGVKARHAAHVMSEYWDAPIDQIDWDARAVRLLIEAVCERAGLSLPFDAAAPLIAHGYSISRRTGAWRNLSSSRVAIDGYRFAPPILRTALIRPTAFQTKFMPSASKRRRPSLSLPSADNASSARTAGGACRRWRRECRPSSQRTTSLRIPRWTSRSD